MARGEKPMEFDVTTVNQEIGLWNEARFVLTERYVGRTLVGGTTDSPTHPTQSCALLTQSFTKGVAISIEAQVLNPGETTEVFIAKVNNDG